MAEIGPLSQASCCHYRKPTSGSLFPEPGDQRSPLWMLQRFSQVSGVLNNPPDGGRLSVGGLYLNKCSHTRVKPHTCVALAPHYLRADVRLSIEIACASACRWRTLRLVLMLQLQSVSHLLLPSGDLCVSCPAPPPPSPSPPSFSARDTQHQ